MHSILFCFVIQVFHLPGEWAESTALTHICFCFPWWEALGEDFRIWSFFSALVTWDSPCSSRLPSTPTGATRNLSTLDSTTGKWSGESSLKATTSWTKRPQYPAPEICACTLLFGTNRSISSRYEWDITLHFTFDHWWFHARFGLQVGYETEGFGDTLRKYVRNLTSDSLDEVLSGKASRRPRQAGPPSDAPELEQIMQMLKLTPKDPKEMRGTAYVKIFGQQTRFAVLNPQTISRFILELISQSRNMIPRLTGEGLPLDQRRATMLMDTKLQFPTVMGVPIQNSVRIPIVAGVKGKVRINMEPKPAEGFSFFKQTPEKVSAS